MKIIPLYQSSDGCNTYIVGSDRNECVIIDAGADVETVGTALCLHDLRCVAVLMTHGHFDHFPYLSEYVSSFGCRVYMHPLDADMLSDPQKNASARFGLDTAITGVATESLSDGDELNIAGLCIKVIHTPGHTPGSVSYLIENSLFSGDTLFCGSVGRRDLNGGDGETLARSLSKLCVSVGDDVTVFPGHGSKTKMSVEKAYNPYLKGCLP